MKNNRTISATLALAACLGLASEAKAQGAIDAFRYSQPDLKGTARYMSMGGAFGALGGDLSTLSQNPGGIGVYRNSEVGITFDLDFQNSKSTTNLGSFNTDKTKFWVNNVGAVWTMKLKSETVPNFNLGFTYNKAASFTRQYKGNMRLNNSISNYIAARSNSNNVLEEEVAITDKNPNPYQSNAPWISTLGFQSYLMYPYYYSDGDDKEILDWKGQWIPGTSGTGGYNVYESGGIDEYNIALGGNISNVLFWGMDFGITSLSYNLSSDWGENLNNALVNDYIMDNQFLYSNQYSASGTGFNYKIGVIVKPIQELRIGFAVHTPTWYNISESYIGSVNFDDPGNNWKNTTIATNNGIRGSDSFNFRTPMKLIASVAGVIGGRFIISADYEWSPYNKMKFSAANDYIGDYGYYYGYSYGYDDYSNNIWRPSPQQPATRANIWENTDPFHNLNADIQDYYGAQNTLRLGAEFRVTSRFSVRAGYSYVSAPTTQKVRENQIEVFPSGTLTGYRLNNETNYVTCGLGYKVGNFYVDAAYVYKHLSAQYRPYPAYPGVSDSSPKADLSLDNNQIFLTCGFKF